MDWFTVDRAGLAGLLERRGRAFAVLELVQNAWDAGATEVAVTLAPLPGAARATITVIDNAPGGFIDIDDSHVLFGRSRSGHDPEKRGRFCMGEKLFLALCTEVRIVSVRGAIEFFAGGRRRISCRTTVGSNIAAELRLTREQISEITDAMAALIPPVGVAVTFNGAGPRVHVPIGVFNAKLPTEIMGDGGVLLKSIRTTKVEAYRAEFSERGEVLEMGIPVCSADWPWRLNVMQKIPLNMERDSVTEAFRRALEVAATNALSETITEEQAAEPWALEAAADARIQPEAFRALQARRFGDRAVTAVPGDPVANAEAEAHGYKVIHGGAMSAGAWANARKFGALPPASSVFPSPSAEQVALNAKAVDALGALPVCPMCGQNKAK